MDLFNYSRRQATEVNIGATPMGGAHPIRIQSMTNTITMDTEACVEQAKRIIDAGGEYVRMTTQGVREAENMKFINIGLRSQGYMFMILVVLKKRLVVLRMLVLDQVLMLVLLYTRLLTKIIRTIIIFIRM